MCDESLLFNGRCWHQKRSIFDVFKQQYLTLVENAHTEFKPERLDFLAKNIYGTVFYRDQV
jgi:hypothetical protein